MLCSVQPGHGDSLPGLLLQLVPQAGGRLPLALRLLVANSAHSLRGTSGRVERGDNCHGHQLTVLGDTKLSATGTQVFQLKLYREDQKERNTNGRQIHQDSVTLS